MMTVVMYLDSPLSDIVAKFSLDGLSKPHHLDISFDTRYEYVADAVLHAVSQTSCPISNVAYRKSREHGQTTLKPQT